MNIEAFEFIETGVLSDGEIELHLIERIPADEKGFVPTYRFELRLGERVVGGIRFRAGFSRDIEWYAGNLGYNVDPEFRGRRFAERACRLLIPLTRAHGFDSLWITCDPGNDASRITCERLGAVLVDVVNVPEHEKCRYRLDINQDYKFKRSNP